MQSYEFVRKKSNVNKNVFLTYISIVIICKCLNLSVISDYVPYSAVYASFIVLWGGAALFRIKFKKRLSYSTKLMIPLMLYYVIWGLNNISNIDKDDAYGHLLRSIIFVLFIIISCFWVKKYNILNKFIRIMYCVFSVYLFVWLIFSFPEIDIFRTLSSFWSFDNAVRHRVYFGFLYPNIAAEMAACTLIFSKMVKPMDKSWRMIKAINNLLLILIVIANNSRGSLLALILFEVLYFYLNNKGNKAVKSTWRWITLGTAIVIGYIVYLVVAQNMSLLEILAGTNRQAALYENVRSLANSGRWLWGVGRLTGGFFSSKTIFYGAQTGFLEVFYFEVFITTGIIGSISMAIIVGFYIRGVVNSSRIDSQNPFSRWIFCILIYMLFVSLFEVYFFSYVYESSMCLNIIVLSYIDIVHNNRDLKRTNE